MSARTTPAGVKATFRPSGSRNAADPAVAGVERREREARDGRGEREGKIHDRVHERAPPKAVAGEHPREEEAEDRVEERGGESRPEAQPVGRERARRRHDAEELRRRERRRLHEESGERHEDEEADVEKRDAESRPEPGKDAVPAGSSHRPGLVELVERAAVVEVDLLGPPPSAEDVVDREEGDLREIAGARGRDPRAPRPEVVLRRDRLRLVRVEELEVGLRRGARAVLVGVPVHEGDGRLGEDAHGRDDDLETALADVPRQEERLALPGDEDVPEAALGERRRGAAGAGVEDGDVPEERARGSRGRSPRFRPVSSGRSPRRRGSSSARRRTSSDSA